MRAEGVPEANACDTSQGSTAAARGQTSDPQKIKPRTENHKDAALFLRGGERSWKEASSFSILLSNANKSRSLSRTRALNLHMFLFSQQLNMTHKAKMFN